VRGVDDESEASGRVQVRGVEEPPQSKEEPDEPDEPEEPKEPEEPEDVTAQVSPLLGALV